MIKIRINNVNHLILIVIHLIFVAKLSVYGMLNVNDLPILLKNLHILVHLRPNQ